MSRIDEIYDEKAIILTAKKANNGTISSYVKNFYVKCKDKIGDMTLETFGARTANYNPNKSGIGQESQIDLLIERKKYPKILSLPNRGDNSISLWKYADGTLHALYKKCGAAIDAAKIIGGIKTFDAICEEENNTKLFVFKTVDIGTFSNSKGGGHQDNVREEISKLIDCVGAQNIFFEDKPVEIIILIDGRSADNIIAHCKPNIQGTTIVIGKSETI